MQPWQRYRLRLERKRWRLRALRKRRELEPVADRTAGIVPRDALVFSTFRNEMPRLAEFLAHYRDMGVGHFLMVDNGSDDGGGAYLAAQPDVSLWRTEASYKRARFGTDWLNGLARRHGHGHWCLTVDPDELFVYPFHDSRPLRALTDWLDASGLRSFPAMLLDLYPKGALGTDGAAPDPEGRWFDAGNYAISRNPVYGNLWIQGGPRARLFFSDRPERAPALNKIPLVRWHRAYAYVSSTHMLLPRGLNRTYDEWGGEKACGVLLHTKLMSGFPEKAREELERRQHFAASAEYRAYAEGLEEGREPWCAQSERYEGWRQLEELGLMSRGGWA
ncbi:glycosyltransferase family 2 protein [Limimaricola pyoseonensis]|uniref:Glycosyl transferase family 2 n=1 Tax=Limimaricola pyoseonensis TaxID=521013 RepID=A0A1G7ET93_9RHOB|nr:glycosyltransferase family 2 protein [Limimaricola pyoseonensis]SDE66903.1 Glycosyl transferase family 2 [Limimaricola pyoseonensis]